MKRLEESDKLEMGSTDYGNQISPRRRLAVSPFRFLLIFFFLLFGWALLAPYLATRLIVEKPLEHADVILILGGSATYKERTEEAAHLFRAGMAPKIWLTNDGTKGGWNQKEQRNPYFYERARWALIEQGVPENSIEVLPEIVEGTIDEARVFSKTAKERSLKSVLIVTSAYHSSRALWTFEKVLAENEVKIQTGILTAPLGEKTPEPVFWWLNLDGWRFVALEYVKSIYYSVYY